MSPRQKSEPLTNRERQARWRARQKAKAAGAPPPDAVLLDPAGELARWSREKLKVPPGHANAGQPMELPVFIVDFLRAGWRSPESALSVARKNAKSAGIAVLMLGHLCGPLATPAWRGAVASVNKPKAKELLDQVEAIAVASRLPVKVYRTPWPGRIEGPAGGMFEVLSSDASAGHASGFDLVCVDETGLLEERDRSLLAGLRSSVSARGGRVVHISVRGDSPLFREVLENPANVVHVHAAPAGSALDDREAWRAANPTLGVVKMESYMVGQVRRLAGAPLDEADFRAFDLNEELNPSREMILAPSDLEACYADDDQIPERSGPVVLGLDVGEATSATAAVAIWPDTGRLESWMAFGDVPDLKTRGKKDNANYLAMEDRGELKTYPGRVVPVAEFLGDVAEALGDSVVHQAAADNYKRAELSDWLDASKAGWPFQWRRVGAGPSGGRDVRSFQRLIIDRKLRMRANLSLGTAIRNSVLRRDHNGNPGIDKARQRGRIDVLSAAIIAAGLAESMMTNPQDTGFTVIAF